MTPSFTSRTKVICSVSPFKLPRQERPYSPSPHGGMTIFSMPVYTQQDRNKSVYPHMLNIFDSFQAQRDVWQGIGYPGQHITPQFVMVEKIGLDILEHWAKGRIGSSADSGPGVMMIEGTKPTENEISEMFGRQERYMSFLYQQALEFANNKQLVDISSDHRISANWLGKDEVWAKTSAELAGDRCPFCESVIRRNAYVCATCSRTIREIPQHLQNLLLGGSNTVETAKNPTPPPPPVETAKNPRPVAR